MLEWIPIDWNSYHCDCSCFIRSLHDWCMGKHTDITCEDSGEPSSRTVWWAVSELFVEFLFYAIEKICHCNRWRVLSYLISFTRCMLSPCARWWTIEKLLKNVPQRTILQFRTWNMLRYRLDKYQILLSVLEPTLDKPKSWIIIQSTSETQCPTPMIQQGGHC